MSKKLSVLVAFLVFFQTAHSQFLMDMIDTSKDIGKGMLLMYKKFEHIKIGGYIQSQYQVASEKGAPSYVGGDFAPNTNNRFMIRRGRIRFDYVHFAEKKGPSVQFVFQFDGTERGVFIRDFWGRITENKLKCFTFTTGMFARPFGFEVNLSSSDRESPERGRMSQILMKTERDLGAMISFDSRKNIGLFKKIKFDVGLFNGQGLTATTDFDKKKDLISRISLKPLSLSKKIKMTGGVSWLNGFIIQNTKYVCKMNDDVKDKKYIIDSASVNLGKFSPRKYYGADLQLKIKNKAGFTEIRGEFISGTQTGTITSSETPGVLLKGPEAYYLRKFNGAYFYLLQNIAGTKHQFGIKYDWYDPNTIVSKNEIGKPGSNLNAADIKYQDIGFGYNYYVNDNLKLLLWYDRVINEKTVLAGYISDNKDNVFTCRLQFRF